MITLPYIEAIRNASFNLNEQNIKMELKRLGYRWQTREMINCLRRKKNFLENEFLNQREAFKWMYEVYLPKLEGVKK